MGGGNSSAPMAGAPGGIRGVRPDQTDVVELCWRIMKFYAHESCGQCTPCREGTGWLEKICRRVAQGKGVPGDLELMSSIAVGIAGNTICRSARPRPGRCSGS
jgi:NADH-quinone oxidoreductase subunit F